MALSTLLALIFAFCRTSSSVSDPEKGPASSTNRDSDAPVHNDRLGGADLDEGRDIDVDVDADPDDDYNSTDPDEPDSGPQTSRQLRALDPPDRTSLLARIKSFVFPPSLDDSSFVPNYRFTPLISGIVIPFSILLEIPGLTGNWYISTQGFDTVQTHPKSTILDVGLAISIACAVIANICIIVRFLEKRVTTMTLLCILFLSIHGLCSCFRHRTVLTWVKDIINIVAVTVSGADHRFNDGFTYGEAYWMTVCSTVVSFFTNVTLIIDFIRTPDFRTSGMFFVSFYSFLSPLLIYAGSGLTRKQRTLMIILIFLFIYIALGSMINSFMLSLTFINGLYFTVTTIETIGFGDIVPDSTGSRVFVCFYAVFGIINIAVVIRMVQETVREGFHISYLRHLQEVRERRQAALRRKRAEKRWRSAVIWRLREKGAPAWVREHSSQRPKSLLARATRKFFKAAEKIPRSIGRRRGMRLNLEALTHSQLEAAALEAGVPLDTLLPPSYYQVQMENEGDGNADDSEVVPSLLILLWY